MNRKNVFDFFSIIRDSLWKKKKKVLPYGQNWDFDTIGKMEVIYHCDGQVGTLD